MTRDSAFRPPRDAHRRETERRRPRRTHPDARRGEATPASVPERPAPAEVPAASAPATSSAQHREDVLFYAPPYLTGRGPVLRALADRLAQRFVRYLDPSCGLRGDEVVLTPYNCFRLDLLIERPAKDGTRGRLGHAGVLLGEREEADGAPALYDALIVGSGAVDVLYRFEPAGLDAHLDDALSLMSEHDPSLFERDERLHAAASRGPCSGSLRGPEMRLSYRVPPVEVTEDRLPERPAPVPDLVMRRLSAAEPSAWAEDYRHALDYFRIPESQHRSAEALRRRARAA